MKEKPVTRSARGGRPRVGPRLSVSTWLPVDDADRLIKLANRRGVSVSAVVRRIVVLRLRGTPEEEL